jgi:protein gp37
MGEHTEIPWTGATWNPWQGCHKISDGCKYCYMFRDKERYGQNPNVVGRSKPPTFNAPLRWQREAERGDRTGADCLVFTASWSDWFIEEADPWRAEAWAIIRACPLLTFQVLTKRANRIGSNLPPDWGAGYPNVWLMVSVENQAETWRVLELARFSAAVRGLSVEPLLAPVDLTRIDNGGGEKYNALTAEVTTSRGHRFIASDAKPIDWVIVGGESGNETGKYRARPCDMDGIRSVVDQCKEAGVPCHVKQLGSNVYSAFQRVRFEDHHGGDWSEWPESLRVRQFPRAVETPAPTLFPTEGSPTP